MDIRLYFLILLYCMSWMQISAQHEDIPYENIENICKTCICLTAQDADKRYHHLLSCASKNFKHILAHWPDDFGKNHNGVDITATFSGNSINILQQLPATNATLTFSCRDCGIKRLQSPTFMDVPNIIRLDLSWNALTTDELTGDVFRGPFRTTHYEPIGLQELDLTHNQLYTLNRNIFEHTPNLKRLNLSFNKLRTFDNQLIMALTSVPNLEVLDLSYTGIKALDIKVFKALKNLKVLNLAGNNFTEPPIGLKLVGNTLQSLNLAQNPIKEFDEESFTGLNALRRLNISFNDQLKTIANKTFSTLNNLESLYVSHNPLLKEFNLDDLKTCKNLTHLDISHGSLISLKFTNNLIKKNNETLPRPWSKLRSFEINGNPWLCDCDFMTAFETINGGFELQNSITETRCDTPYIFAGALVSNLTASKICSMQIPSKYRVVDEDPPRFLRKRYIILTLITASVVIVLGLIIGFIVSCIRRRLKSQDFGVEPIRYTSVRCSNLSAFSNVNNQNNRSSST